MLWDLVQQSQINQARNEAESASREVKKAIRKMESTPDKFAQLTLITHAVWELLKEQHGLDETDLMNKMEEIDIRDGKQDGKSTPSVVNCVGCGRKIRTSVQHCFYCGKLNPSYSPFSKVTD